jgi:hypothetical protein
MAEVCRFILHCIEIPVLPIHPPEHKILRNAETVVLDNVWNYLKISLCSGVRKISVTHGLEINRRIWRTFYQKKKPRILNNLSSNAKHRRGKPAIQRALCGCVHMRQPPYLRFCHKVWWSARPIKRTIFSSP